MYTFNENLDKKKYDEFVKNYPMANFTQEYNWSNIKDNWDSFHCGLYKDKKLVGVCLILVKTIIKNLKIFYIPRGYLIDFTNYEDLEAMTKYVKDLAKKHKAYSIKIDPNFCISDNNIKGLEASHNYSKDYEIKDKNLKKLKYINTGIHKELGKTLQPQFNIFAPICDKDSNILNEEELLKTYKSKLKYYLGNFHTKRGISFEVSNNIEDLDKFVKLLKETELKQNINLRKKEYFVKILNNYKDTAYLFFGNVNMDKYINFLKENNGKEEDINEALELKKVHGNIITLSAGLLILPANKKGIRTSEYLYAGNSSLLTKLKVNAGLVYEMIKFSMNNNCHYVNLGGVNADPNDHLYMFKQKYNSEEMVFSGEYDLPVSKIYYPIKLFYPLLIKIYKKIKR